MIILFDKDETEFTTLGIGVLSDASSCVVTEELNGAFELEMEYPVNGAHYKDLDYKRLILAKPNDIMQAQPFRIYKITRPINGTVTVYAQHISYDLTKVPIKALNAEKFSDLCYKEDSEGHLIQNGAIKENQMIETPFRFIQGEDKGEVNTSFKTKWPISFRSLLAGTQDSILDTYTGDYEFDRYKVILHNRRGKDRDFVIRYSKNMTDLEHEVSSELIFNGVCPYYNSTTSETKQVIGKKYKEAYISKQAQSGESQPIVYTDSSYGTPIEITIYPANYITYKDGTDGMNAILTTSVTNIINTEDTDSIKLYEHLIHARNIKLTESDKEAPYIFDVTYKMVYINKDSQNEFGSDWLVNSEGTVITHQTWDPSMNPYGPDAPIYRIFTPGAFLYKVFIWDEIQNKYREIESSDKIEEYGPLLPNVGTETEEKDNIILYEGNIIYIGEVRAVVNEDSQQEYSSDWLKLIESENEQRNENDQRWKVGNVIDPTTYPENQIYKVAKLETFIQAYYKQGDLNSNKIPNNFYSNSECTELLVPVDQQGYFVISLEPGDPYGNEFKFRYSAYDKAYLYVTDTRYTYENYIWNGTEYTIRDSSHDEILTLDLTDKFDEQPKNNQKFQKKIYEETLKYVKDNKIGEIKESIKVSFIKLSSSPEYSKWKDLEKVALGDTVHVIYEELGINVLKKVVKTDYNVLKESYDEIELGEKSAKFTTEAIVSGDNVSSLTNDRNFADDITVTNLFAKYIEADYIKGITAEITTAQIDTLTSDSISATLIEAERFEIDKLVANLLVANDAAIKNTLTAGNIVINGGGQLDIKNGSISIKSDDRISEAVRAYINSSATVEYGYDWLKANRSDEYYMEPDLSKIYDVYQIVGDEEIQVGYYRYEPAPTERYIEKELKENVFFEVDEGGNVTANSLKLSNSSGNSHIEIKSQVIETYATSNVSKKYTSEWLYKDQELTELIKPVDGIYYYVTNELEDKYYIWNITEEKYTATTYTDSVFEVDNFGRVTARSLNITDGYIESTKGNLQGISYLTVDQNIKTTDISIAEDLTIYGDLKISNDISINRIYNISQKYFYLRSVPTKDYTETFDIKITEESTGKYLTVVKYTLKILTWPSDIYSFYSDHQNGLYFKPDAIGGSRCIGLYYSEKETYTRSNADYLYTSQLLTNSFYIKSSDNGEHIIEFNIYTDVEPVHVETFSCDWDPDYNSTGQIYYQAYANDKILNINADNVFIKKIGINNTIFKSDGLIDTIWSNDIYVRHIYQTVNSNTGDGTQGYSYEFPFIYSFTTQLPNSGWNKIDIEGIMGRHVERILYASYKLFLSNETEREDYTNRTNNEQISIENDELYLLNPWDNARNIKVRVLIIVITSDEF